MKITSVKKLLIGFIMVALLITVGCSSKNSDKIVISSKEYTEQEILAYIVGLMLEHNTDLNIEMKPYLGGTDIVFSALKSGDVDIYTEYTGTALASILKKDVINDPDEAYRVAKESLLQDYQIEMLDQLGFNNTYVLTVRTETAEQYNLKTISDLENVADILSVGATAEFVEREDGLKGLEKLYGFKFADVKSMNTGLKYIALDEKKIDITSAFSTDGLLVKYDVSFLEDDKQLFPPYHAAPIVRADTLKKHPEIKDVLNRLAGRLNDRTMMELNAQVDVDKKKAKDVAESWLKQEGLIQ